MILAIYTAVHFVAITVDPKRAAAHNKLLSKPPVMAALLAAASYTVVPDVKYAAGAAVLYLVGGKALERWL